VTSDVFAQGVPVTDDSGGSGGNSSGECGTGDVSGVSDGNLKEPRLEGRRRRRRIRRRRKGSTSSASKGGGTGVCTPWGFMYWNARGLEDELAETLTLMEERGISMAGFTETKVFGTDLSRGRWRWINGPETLPAKGDKTAKLGLGVMVDDRKHPNATIDSIGVYTMWVRLPGGASGGDRDLYFGVVYCPVYDSEKKAAMKEIVAGFTRYRDKGVVMMGGDMNVRCGMNGDPVISTPGRVLMRMCDKADIIFVNDMELATGEYTRQQWVELHKGTPEAETVLRRTTIDYTLMAEADTDRVLRFAVGEDCGLDSDHRPQFGQIDMRDDGQRALQRVAEHKEQWNLSEMTVERWKVFERSCDLRMVGWMASFERRDGSQTLEEADQHWRDWLHAFNQAGLESIGRRKVGKTSKSWYPELAEVIKERRAAGKEVRELTGAAKEAAQARLAELRRKLRSVSKRCKRVAELKRLRSVDSSLSSSKNFWKNIKALNRHTEDAHVSLPRAINGKDGEMVTDPVKVLKVWRDFTAELGKEPHIPDPQRGQSDRRGAATRYDDEFARKVQEELREVFVGDGVPELDREITWDEVHSGISMLKAGKAAGLDGVLAEMLQNAGLGCAMALTQLFNYVWRAGVWPVDWQKAFMVPLYKRAGSRLDPSNYRNLSIMSIVAKLFEKILDTRIREWAERMHVLSDLQGGFRCVRATLDQIFILNEIVAERRERGLPTYMGFIDVRKAYDRTWRPGLWYKLRQIGIGGRCLELLQAMYSRVVRKLLINGQYTDEFDVLSGVPQGSVLSPFLYATYINGLHKALADAGLGTRVHGRLVPMLLYADDIVLLTRSADELKAMLKVTHEYARKWRFDVNHGKSNVVVFGSKAAKKEAKVIVWRLGSDVLKVVEIYKYLGIETGKVKGRWNDVVARFYKNAEATLSLLLYRGGGAAGLYPPTFVRQFNAVCRPLVEYGCELWEGEISKKWERKLESVQSAFLRGMAGLKGTPASVGLRAEFGLTTLKSRRRVLKLGYWRKLCISEHSRLFSLVFRRRHEQVLRGDGRFSGLRAFRDLLVECDMEHRWLRGTALEETAWRSAANLAVRAMSEREEAAELSARSSLRLYSELELKQTAIPQYLSDRSNVVGTRLLTKCRMGYLYLMDRVAKAASAEEVSPCCPLCHYGVVEDVEHFLLHCPVLNPCRRQLQSRLQLVLSTLGVPGAELLERFADGREGQLKVLLGDLSLQCEAQDDPVDDEFIHAQAGKARFYTDKAVKNFLVACWRLRESVVGIQTVAGGYVVTAPSSRSADDLVASQVSEEMDMSQVWDGMRSFWFAWIPSPEPEEQMSWPARKGRSAFYAVKKGRTTGIFYKWMDCRASVAGVVDSVFCGRMTLAEAQEWLVRV
jgi:hypothetical protein